jgi:putative peptide chain release factor H
VSAWILQISSGTGPTEVRRFVALLATRLERLAHAGGLEVDAVVTIPGEGGPRSVTLQLTGDAARALADELGTHALLARSEGRGHAGRKRWFAAVMLSRHTPAEALADEPTRDQLIITACRAGGPGGQHVNKVSSAVRVEHLPTGLAVRCAGARSQHINLSQALRRLRTLLMDRTTRAAAKERSERRRAHHRVERGAPVRTYTLGVDGDLREGAP